MKLFNKNKHIFFVGIGGIGMSGIAEILLKKGYRVSGSDRELTDITAYLEQHGATIYEGHSAYNLKNVDVLVYSSAVMEDNPERQRAKKLKIQEIRRAEMLAQIIHHQYCIGISGTHGKTTTTSMCASVLMEGDLDPTIIVGGRLKSLNTNARLGEGEFVVVEADEYDRSFLALSPILAVITSLETDHLDCYENLEDLKNSFIKYANKTPFYGSIICCIDEPVVKEIIPQLNKKCITYGLSSSACYYTEEVNYDNNYSLFNVYYKKELMGSIALKVPGVHNVKNALASIAVGHSLNISFNKIKNALEKYEGVERRFEIKSVINDIMIVDDYAHHPTEVSATIRAAKNGWDKRIIAVFQPHLYSRTRDFYKEFAEALNESDIIFITDVYPAREIPIAGISGAIICNALKNMNHQNVFYVADKANLAEEINKILQPNDMVITIGAGDIWKVSNEINKGLKN
jgi:UDP-N-acetylmuramate--alanine ligase